jgi:D-alanyl-D-alanine carboxypeptidase
MIEFAIDTSPFVSIDDLNRDVWYALFLTRWGNHLLNPIIVPDFLDLGHRLTSLFGPGSVRIFSLFRSIKNQRILKNTRRWTWLYRYTAFPGESEHHLWTAIDFEFLRSASLAKNRMRDHAWEYWFIQSFPHHCKVITGIPAEDWHYRRIGKELAALFWKVSAANTTLCLQQFLQQLWDYDIMIAWADKPLIRAKQRWLSEKDYRFVRAIEASWSWFLSFCTNHPLIMRACEIAEKKIRVGLVTVDPESFLYEIDPWKVLLLDQRLLYWKVLWTITPFGWISSAWRWSGAAVWVSPPVVVSSIPTKAFVPDIRSFSANIFTNTNWRKLQE